MMDGGEEGCGKGVVKSVGKILTLLREFPGKGSATVGRKVVLPLWQGSRYLCGKGQVAFGQRSDGRHCPQGGGVLWYNAKTCAKA